MTIYHLLKLFQADPAAVTGKKNVVSEHYDEVVFTDPTNAMYNVLTNPKPLVPQIKHEADVNCEWRYTAGGKECMGACQVELHHVCVQQFSYAILQHLPRWWAVVT